jgi:hypothetical protein
VTAPGDRRCANVGDVRIVNRPLPVSQFMLNQH